MVTIEATCLFGGDGACDGENNNLACNYDDGDCCLQVSHCKWNSCVGDDCICHLTGDSHCEVEGTDKMQVRSRDCNNQSLLQGLVKMAATTFVTRGTTILPAITMTETVVPGQNIRDRQGS